MYASNLSFVMTPTNYDMFIYLDHVFTLLSLLPFESLDHWISVGQFELQPPVVFPVAARVTSGSLPPRHAAAQLSAAGVTSRVTATAAGRVC